MATRVIALFGTTIFLLPTKKRGSLKRKHSHRGKNSTLQSTLQSTLSTCWVNYHPEPIFESDSCLPQFSRTGGGHRCSCGASKNLHLREKNNFLYKISPQWRHEVRPHVVVWVSRFCDSSCTEFTTRRLGVALFVIRLARSLHVLCVSAFLVIRVARTPRVVCFVCFQIRLARSLTGVEVRRLLRF